MDVNVQELVTNIIVEKLSVVPSAVTREAHIQNDLGADSLDTVELIMAFEDALKEEGYEIQIPEEKAEQIHTVGDAIDFIEAAIKEKK
ncbi:MAG TPA: acyl carrier protein [Bacteroidales bacterium]|nr:acyl carrier protein [Bacteroidales bacterium]